MIDILIPAVEAAARLRAVSEAARREQEERDREAAARRRFLSTPEGYVNNAIEKAIAGYSSRTRVPGWAGRPMHDRLVAAGYEVAIVPNAAWVEYNTESQREWMLAQHPELYANFAVDYTISWNRRGESDDR